MRIVGLSGSIATGKSTVTTLLRQRKVVVIDCDEIAKQVVAKGQWGYRRVVAAFGTGILTGEGEVDREKLGRLVFADREARVKLNTATHLPVGVAILQRVLWHWLTCCWLVVIDMPLLFETGAYHLTSPRVLVACDNDIQVERLVKRDRCSREEAEAKIRAQMPLEAKRQLADYVIDNSGTLPQLHSQVFAMLKSISSGAVWQGMVSSPLSLTLLLGMLWRVWK
ncbi:hypothetical protein WJX72_002721 [[Myrmecia] bisecta]|uniref:Dephospho-CoA kinase n=1 Tax=[Myrmecia] bisecta TaxID=41462 RepID=A0AAW1QF25_9CHLO